jgi:AcrR family transcriptional regulator
MVKIDLARRAEIGRAKSARTRELLLDAARSLYAQQAIETVTVEDVVREAGVAKGTFYIHFKNIEAVQMTVADGLTETFVELLQPHRDAFEDPIERIANGCYTFLHHAAVNPKLGGLVARYAWSFPVVGKTARTLLAEDLLHAMREGRVSEISPDLAAAMVVGIVLHVMRSASEGILHRADMPLAVIAILKDATRRR